MLLRALRRYVLLRIALLLARRHAARDGYYVPYEALVRWNRLFREITPEDAAFEAVMAEYRQLIDDGVAIPVVVKESPHG